jgi:hypothetical protein
MLWWNNTTFKLVILKNIKCKRNGEIDQHKLWLEKKRSQRYNKALIKTLLIYLKKSWRDKFNSTNRNYNQ